MGKKGTTESIREVSESSSHPVDAERQSQDAQWTPGFAARFPWIGFGALFTVFVCVVGSIVTLVTSNGKSATQWPKEVAPNVLLSLMNNVANICFSIAIGNGIAIAWWRTALKGASIQELHRSWSFSTSLKDIMFSLRHLNLIALAALTAKLTIIDGVLMQRATTTETRINIPVNVTNIRGFANETFPNSSGASGLSKAWLRDDLQIWSQSGGVLPNRWSGCEGLCFLNVAAAGFAFDCTDPVTTAIDYGNETVAANKYLDHHNGTMRGSGLKLFEPLFSVKFEVYFASNHNEYGDGRDYSYVNMSLLYTQASGKIDHAGSASCPGSRTEQSCVLRPAVIEYPVQIQNFTGAHATSDVKIGATLDAYRNESTDVISGAFNQTLKQNNGYEILHYSQFLNPHGTMKSIAHATDTHLVGIEEALRMYLGGEAAIFADTSSQWEMTQHGNAAQYLLTAPPDDKCSFWYRNPLVPDTQWGVPSVVSKINQIMFSLATDISREDPSNDYSQSKQYNATMYMDSIHYVSHYGFMAGAAASTITCILLCLPVYWGFWQLGRKVTLGPFEIAHAFRSPMTAQATNGTVDELMREVGHRQIQYGQIVAGEARGVLGVAEPEYVARIDPDIGAPREEIHEMVDVMLGRRAHNGERL